jgi:hypothetical protein
VACWNRCRTEIGAGLDFTGSIDRGQDITNSAVRLTRSGEVAVIVVDHPPVNALSQAVREGLLAALSELAAESGLRAAVIACDGPTFIAGVGATQRVPRPAGPLVAHLHPQQAAEAQGRYGASAGRGYMCGGKTLSGAARLPLPQSGRGGVAAVLAPMRLCPPTACQQSDSKGFAGPWWVAERSPE